MNRSFNPVTVIYQSEKTATDKKKKGFGFCWPGGPKFSFHPVWDSPVIYFHVGLLAVCSLKIQQDRMKKQKNRACTVEATTVQSTATIPLYVNLLAIPLIHLLVAPRFI